MTQPTTAHISLLQTFEHFYYVTLLCIST